MYGLLVGFGLMFDKGQKQSSTLSCDSSYSWGSPVFAPPTDWPVSYELK